MELEPGDARRLIPACAGKTQRRGPGHAPARAHPRVCGENARRPFASAMIFGSSPRVRGKLHSMEPRRHRCGLIPACAGKTVSKAGMLVRLTAHPRVCGENPGRQCGTARLRGSSPRVRGKLGGDVRALARPRLIPACAGKTLRSTTTSCPTAAHPRVCGENGRIGVPVSLASGSSPRVRGKLRDGRGDEVAARLIPACAGKTIKGRRYQVTGPAHPRVCGENSEW